MLHMFLGKHDFKFACIWCLRSCSSPIVLLKCRQRYEQQKITAIKTSKKSHLYCKKKLS